MEKLFQHLTKLMHSRRLYTNPSLSRKQVAEALSTNETYLYKTIRREVGLTFAQYIYSLRLEHACNILIQDDHHQHYSTVERIANECGYRSRKTFHAHFRRKYGCTPIEYRQKNKRTNNHTEAL